MVHAGRAQRGSCSVTRMRSLFAAVVLVVVLAPEAAAQMSYGQTARTAPVPPEVAAQATFDTSYLLALYMTQLAAAGSPPSPADIDKAARQYFTNGAAVVGVPTTGPGAAYFRNGAEVMAYPTPRAAPATATPVPAPAGYVRTEPLEVDAGVAAPAGTPGVVGSAPTPELPAPANEARGPTCPPSEIAAAMAFASQFASAEAPRTAPACPPPSASPTPIPAPPTVAPAAESAVEATPLCPAGPSVLSRIAPPLGGVLFGGLAVVLWSRPRLARAARARNAR